MCIRDSESWMHMALFQRTFNGKQRVVAIEDWEHLTTCTKLIKEPISLASLWFFVCQHVGQQSLGLGRYLGLTRLQFFSHRGIAMVRQSRDQGLVQSTTTRELALRGRILEFDVLGNLLPCSYVIAMRPSVICILNVTHRRLIKTNSRPCTFGNKIRWLQHSEKSGS